MSLKGNKGEWSELYVFLKLLADEKLSAIDSHLNKLSNSFYPINKIIRETEGKIFEYRIGEEISIVDIGQNAVIRKISKKEIIEFSQLLFIELKNSEAGSIEIPEINTFLESIKIRNLKANSTDKSDIKVNVHDLKTGLAHTLGFSIKSMLGRDSTLLNAGKTTNFIYKIKNLPAHDETVEFVNSFNKENSPAYIARRIQEIYKLGGEIEFQNNDSKNFFLNMQLIDSELPHIIAQILLLKYKCGINSFLELLTEINKLNPINYDLELKHPFYEYKFKNFLTDVALGMTPSHLWEGKYDATGGIIIVKPDGDIGCFHIYNRTEFQDYLIQNTRLDQASTTRHKFGNLYLENGELLLKLNLQIRFK